jgi:hypothetical protein
MISKKERVRIIADRDRYRRQATAKPTQVKKRTSNSRRLKVRVIFRLDAETKTRLDAMLQVDEGQNVRGRTSIFLRKLIHEEFERRDKKKSETEVPCA